MDELTFANELNSPKKRGDFPSRLERLERKQDYLIALVETMMTQRTEQVTSARAAWLDAHRRRRAS